MPKPVAKTAPSPRSEYVVTDTGGLRPTVAGKVRTVGETVMLTEVEAEWDVKRGLVITPEEAEKRKAAAEAAAAAKASATD